MLFLKDTVDLYSYTDSGTSILSAKFSEMIIEHMDKGYDIDIPLKVEHLTDFYTLYLAISVSVY